MSLRRPVHGTRQHRAALGLALAAALLPASVAAAAPIERSGMYDDRYCEYLIVEGTPPKLDAAVWNTYGLNACPPKQWAALDAPTLTRETGALFALRNGPRHWLVERVTIRLPAGVGEVRTFSNGLRMRHIASVRVPFADGKPANRPYQEVTVARANTFTWSRRHPVHELVAPGGRVYVMQAFAQITDPSLSTARLRGLGRRLKLPDGWRYRTRRLTRDLAVTTQGRATVTQDEFQNTYQLVR